MSTPWQQLILQAQKDAASLSFNPPVKLALREDGLIIYEGREIATDKPLADMVFAALTKYQVAGHTSALTNELIPELIKMICDLKEELAKKG